jgi:Spy/CpxP family protein refolding chaperone
MAPAPRNAVRTTVIAGIVVVVTFIAGFMSGVVVDRFTHRPDRPPRSHPMVARAMLHRLDQHLQLDDAQEKKIEEILERRRARIDALWSGVRSQVRAEIDETNAEIESVLTPEQRTKFEKMRMRLGPHDGMRRRRGDRDRTESTR